MLGHFFLSKSITNLDLSKAITNQQQRKKGREQARTSSISRRGALTEFLSKFIWASNTNKESMRETNSSDDESQDSNEQRLALSERKVANRIRDELHDRSESECSLDASSDDIEDPCSWGIQEVPQQMVSPESK